jgi:hypothetical protein
MAPSGVNNAWREQTARIKRWYEDISAVQTTTGSSNAYLLSASRTISAYAAGDVFLVKANHTCTGAGSTINVDSVGVKSIVTPEGGVLGAGDITSGGIYLLAYEASVDKFMLVGGGSAFPGDVTVTTADGAILNLNTSDTTVTAASVLGRTNFTAPVEASGTDSILLAASIAAVAEGTFAADNNATALEFMTAASEAASVKMKLSSGGNLTLPTDGTVIAAGADSDVTLAHNHDLGLTLSAGANATQLTITSTDAGASAAPTVALVRNSASPAASDQLGHINFTGEDAGSNATAYAQIIGNIIDPSSGGEDGSLDFYCIEAGTAVKALNLTGGDVSLPTDAAILKFGLHDDVLLSHVADSGLTMSVTGNNVAQFTVSQDKDDASTGPVLNLDRYSASPADSDGGGLIQFNMENDNDQLFTAAQIYAVAADVTDGTEDGKLIINTMKNGTATTALTIAETGAATFAGDIDVDGTANLDIVDVDGAVNFAADVTFADGADIITASAGTSNFRAGVNTGNSIASGGNYNTLVGDEAGTAITTGDQNTAVGYQALDANETSSNNTAIGYNALTAHTGGNATAIGNLALAANTTDSYGVAVGYAALTSNTTGTLNTAVGSFTLTNNNGAGGGGDYNTAMGYAALYTNTEGNQCTGIGYYAGFANSTGTHNTSTGYYALGATSTGSYNTGLGAAAGDSITTGNYNVCVGYATDISAVGGANQISIGTNVSCSENSQVSIGQSGSAVRNEFDTDAAWTQSSDARKKKDIEDAVLGLDFVNDLRPVTYEWKPNNEFPEDFAEYNEENFMTLDVRMHGLVAQEVKVALDKTGVERFAGWKEDSDGSQRISKEMFVIPLIKAVQELSAKNDALEARITALESA